MGRFHFSIAFGAVLSLATASSATALVSGSDPVATSAFPHIYAQQLVDEAVKSDPDLLNVLVHVSAPGASKNTVVAAELASSLGEVSGEDDLGVMRTGSPLVEVQKDGVRIGVVVQMKDRAGHPIGALGLVYPYRTDESQAAFLHRAEVVRDGLARQIASLGALFSPV